MPHLSKRNKKLNDSRDNKRPKLHVSFTEHVIPKPEPTPWGDDCDDSVLDAAYNKVFIPSSQNASKFDSNNKKILNTKFNEAVILVHDESIKEKDISESLQDVHVQKNEVLEIEDREKLSIESSVKEDQYASKLCYRKRIKFLPFKIKDKKILIFFISLNGGLVLLEYNEHLVKTVNLKPEGLHGVLQVIEPRSWDSALSESHLPMRLIKFYSQNWRLDLPAVIPYYPVQKYVQNSVFEMHIHSWECWMYCKLNCFITIVKLYEKCSNVDKRLLMIHQDLNALIELTEDTLHQGDYNIINIFLLGLKMIKDMGLALIKRNRKRYKGKWIHEKVNIIDSSVYTTDMFKNRPWCKQEQGVHLRRYFAVVGVLYSSCALPLTPTMPLIHWICRLIFKSRRQYLYFGIIATVANILKNYSKNAVSENLSMKPFLSLAREVLLINSQPMVLRDVCRALQYHSTNQECLMQLCEYSENNCVTGGSCFVRLLCSRIQNTWGTYMNPIQLKTQLTVTMSLVTLFYAGTFKNTYWGVFTYEHQMTGQKKKCRCYIQLLKCLVVLLYRCSSILKTKYNVLSEHLRQKCTRILFYGSLAMFLLNNKDYLYFCRAKWIPFYQKLQRNITDLDYPPIYEYVNMVASHPWTRRKILNQKNPGVVSGWTKCCDIFWETNADHYKIYLL